MSDYPFVDGHIDKRNLYIMVVMESLVCCGFGKKLVPLTKSDQISNFLIVPVFLFTDTCTAFKPNIDFTSRDCFHYCSVCIHCISLLL